MRLLHNANVGCHKKVNKGRQTLIMATTVTQSEGAMDKWTPQWHAAKFMQLYTTFVNNLGAMYPTCPLVASEKHVVTTMQGAPEDVVDTYVKQWHDDMSAQVKVDSLDATMYSLAKQRDALFFTSDANAVCCRLGMAPKWSANNLDAASRESIWQYFERLNKCARFVALAPRSLLATLTELAQSEDDISQPQVMETMMKRLGPEIAANFTQLTNATALLGDIMEEFLGAEMGGMVTELLDNMQSGGTGELDVEQLTSLLPGFLSNDTQAVDFTQVSAMCNQLMASVPQTPESQTQMEAQMKMIQDNPNFIKDMIDQMLTQNKNSN